MASKINTITGHQSNDLLYATSANDAIDGGAGIDTVVFSRKMSDFKLTKQGTSWVIDGTAVGAGTDTLNNVEFIRFSDGTLNLATGKLISAALAPSLTATAVSGAEDGAIALKIASSFTSVSGAEQLSIIVSGVPAAAKLSAGTLGHDGSWTLTAAQLQGLTITPPANSDADFALTIKATLTDPVTGTSATSTAVESITVNAVADAPTLTVQAATGTADTAIALNLAAALTDTDGSESLAVTIAGVPTGAKLSAGTLNSNGNWSLTQAQLAGLTITPVAHSDADFTLTVTATATEAVGGATAVKVASLPVTVNPAPTAPTAPVFATSGTTTTVTGTAGNDTLDLSKVTTPTNSVDGGAGTDTVILPYNQEFYRFAQDSQGNWVASEVHATGQSTTLTGVEYLKFTGTSGVYDTSGKLISTGATTPPPSTTPGTTSAPTLTAQAANGNEDAAIALTIAAALTDTTIAESLGIVVSGVPTGAKLSGGTLNSDGTWSLTPAQLAGLTITPPANSDADFTLTVTATATQTANGVSAVKVATLPVTVNAVADAPTLTAQAATGTVDTAIALNLAAALTDTDGSESLAVTIAGVPTGAKLSAGTLNSNGSWSLTQAQLTGLTLTPVAHSDADFTLTVTATATEAVGGATAVKVASLPVTVNAAPTAPTAPVFATSGNTTTVTGTAGNDTLDLSKLTTLTNSVDGGAGTDTVILPYNQEFYRFAQDSQGNWVASEVHATGQSTTLTGVEYLKFTGTSGVYDTSGKLISTGTTTPPPSTTPSTTSAPTLTVQAASGSEDSAIALTVAAALTDTTIAESLGIVVSGVPTGAKLSGGTLNSDGTWSLTPAQLAGLTITPPANSDADFTLTVTATATQTANGVSAVKVATLPVTVNAVADAPTLTAQAATGTVDTAIALNLAAALTDTDGSESLAVTIAGVPTGAKLSAGTLNSNGSWSLTQAQLTGLTLTPVAHSDADFTLTVTATATEAVGGATAVKVASLPVTVNAAPTAPTAPVFATSGNTTTVTGTAGNDMLDLSKLTTLTNSVDGGAGTDTVILPYNQEFYRFAQDSQGNWVASEVHATGQSTTLTGVEYLKFTGTSGVYDTSGKLISTGTTTPPPSTTPSTTPTPTTGPTSIIHEPTVIQASLATEVVGMKLQNNTAVAEHGSIVSFGQLFSVGDVMPGNALVAHINGQDYAVQMDVRALNPDGSVRHAVLSLHAPDIAAGGAVDVMLVKSSAPAAASTLQPSDILSHGYDLSIDANIHNADGSKTAHSIDGASVLRQAIADGKVETLMKGPLVSEFRVETDVTANLRATLDIKIDANGHFTTDVIMANDATFNQIATVNYDVTINEGGKVAFTDPDIAQYRNSTWHHEVSTTDQPNLHVVYDMDYMNGTGAIPTLDTSIGANLAVLDAQTAALANADTGPMGNALVLKDMPQTGARADIGPTTAWTASYLVSQDERAEAVMLANADVSGSVPWHFRDETTGEPVRIDQHPSLFIDYRAGDAGTTGPTTPYVNISQDTGWAPDRAHMPSLAYEAYLTTGDHYYLDEMQAEVSWQLASSVPGYRDLIGEPQVRDLAWSLRDLGNVAYITPDADPLKGYFNTAINGKLDQLVKYYVTDHTMAASGAVEGWVKGAYSSGVSAPWQQDFLATTLGVLDSQGYEQAGVLLKWMDNFISGRFLHEADGFNPLHGAAYNLTVADPVTNIPYSTWSQVYNASYGNETTAPTQFEGYPDEASGTAAMAKAALASIITVTGSVHAIEAYGYVVSQTPNMPAAYASDPTWAISPQLADGTPLENTDIHIGDTGNNIMTGTDHNELLHGGAGNDTIHGGGGIDFLFGGDGDDLVFGDVGNDFLFGGAGNDTLNGGAGDNFLKGGAGADTFVFDTVGAGHDTIADFSPTEDWLRIKQNLDGDGITTTDQVLSQATQNADGNVVLHLGAHHDVTLDGITKAMLLAHPTAITMIA